MKVFQVLSYFCAYNSKNFLFVFSVRDLIFSGVHFEFSLLVLLICVDSEPPDYSFPIRRLKKTETNKSLFSLIISDNGKGIPEDIELESLESPGLQLVSALVGHLDGEIEIMRTLGTEFRITFNVAEKL